jgi:hypothetical protein
MPRGRGAGGGGIGFIYDVSDIAIDYVKKSIKHMPGNNGQKVLVEKLEFFGYMWMRVSFDGDEFDISCTYDLNIRSSHPEAIEIIIKTAYEKYKELGERLDGGGGADQFTGTGILNSLTDLLRSDAYDYAASQQFS